MHAPRRWQAGPLGTEGVGAGDHRAHSGHRGRQELVSGGLTATEQNYARSEAPPRSAGPAPGTDRLGGHPRSAQLSDRGDAVAEVNGSGVCMLYGAAVCRESCSGHASSVPQQERGLCPGFTDCGQPEGANGTRAPPEGSTVDGHGVKPGCQCSTMERSSISASSWHRMPTAPAVTRWMSSQLGGRFSDRPVRKSWLRVSPMRSA